MTQVTKQRILISVCCAGVFGILASLPLNVSGEELPAGVEREFSTDFSKHSVPYHEILSGGPPKDGIPAIDAPKFESVKEADTWLKAVEPVILLNIEEDARAYPMQILVWHEIANDVVGGVPLVVTFCPLCNTAVAFDRRFKGDIFDFGTTGRLRNSNLIMYDRQHESWWQQATGEAIAGRFTGERLTLLPAMIIAWEEFKNAYPEGKVLSRDTGFARQYGRNPYVGYDDINNSPFLFRGETDGRLLPMTRVVTIEIGIDAVAYPYELLEKQPVIHDSVGETPIVLFWQAGTASALDAGNIAEGRDVGAVNSYSRKLDGEVLSFLHQDGRILDEQGGSEWNLLGEAISGPLEGSRLQPVVHINHFWFSWAAFRPDTRIFQLDR
ncbi:MAG: DUF3179 domain-containing protein [bacterium]|nr:DUF3179 domain-containing protein [bacterium]